MKGGITKRIEDTVKALDAKQLKKALALTESNPQLDRHHQWIAEAAQTCLSKPEACDASIKAARGKVVGTTQLDMDSTDLEGIEEYLKPGRSTMVEQPKVAEKTDAELFESCEECHVSAAVVQFHRIAEGCGDAETVAAIDSTLKDDLTPPETWVRKMVAIAEKESCGQPGYQAALGELTEYLEKRGSPLLVKLDEGALDKPPVP